MKKKFSLVQAEKLLKEYEDEDRNNGSYEPDFYEIVRLENEK